MKAEFQFNVGRKVTAASGLTGKIVVCGVTKNGVEYLVRGTYSEQWVPEEQIKPANGKKNEETTEQSDDGAATPAAAAAPVAAAAAAAATPTTETKAG